MRAPPTILGDPNKPTDITRWIERIALCINGNISFGATMANGNGTAQDTDININCWKSSGTSPVAPNTDFTIAHSLGRIPITIVGQDTNNGGLLYRGSVAWTKTSVTLRCTTASAAYNVIVA